MSQPEAYEDRRREEGSALLLTLITLMVIFALVGTHLSSSVTEGRAASGSVEHKEATFAATAGLWAAANSLSNGGDGTISGTTTSGDYAPQSGEDSDGDGYIDFSDRATFLGQADGYFEGRAKSLGTAEFFVRARAKVGGTIRTLEGLMVGAPDGAGVSHPFTRGGFGDLKFHLDSNVTTDSYDSDVSSYESHPTTTTSNGQPIKNQNGHIGSNGDISLDSNSTVFGNASPGPTGTLTIGGSSVVNGDTSPLESEEEHAPPTWEVPTTSDTLAKLGIPHGSSFSSDSGTKTISGSATLVISSLSLDGNSALKIQGTSDDVIEIYIVGGDSPGAEASFKLDSNSKLQIFPHDKENGPTVKVYNVGKFQVNSNSQLNTESKGNPNKHYSGDPIQFQYFSTYDSSSDSDIGVHFNSNNNSSGVFYAPESLATYDSNSHLWGAVVTDEIEFNSNVFLHYDESLGNYSPASTATPQLLFVPGMVREVR